MLFNPDLLHNKSWWSFFYSARYNYLDADVRGYNDEELLAADWVKRINAKIKADEALTYLFTDLPDSTHETNAFYREVQKHPAIKQYFDMAKAIEGLSALPSPWEEDEKLNREIAVKRDQTIKSLQMILEREKDSFLKRKYAFQLVKLAYYAKDALSFNNAYNQYFKNKNNDVLDWWAMHYKSMMLESLEQFDSANYMHALVFSHSSNKMFASKDFFSRKRLENVLTLANNDSEKADVYLLAEVINPGRSLAGIQKVYKYSPNHRHLPLLISREINKLEDWLGAERYANTTPVTSPINYTALDNTGRDREYLAQFIKAMENMPAFGQANADLYNLSMAYLHLMNNNFEVAGNFLDKVDSRKEGVFYEKIVLQIVLLTEKQDITQASVQNEIGVLFEDLLTKRGHQFESHKILYSLSSYLRYVFANKNMVHLAGLFDNYAINKFCFECDWPSFEYSLIQYFDKHASVGDMKKLIALYNAKEKNALEKILLRPYSNPYFFYDLLSVKYLQSGDVSQALQTLNNIPDEFWYSFNNALYNLDRDPFIDNPDLFGVQTMVSYNKREIVQKLFNLEQEAVREPTKRAANYFKLGNAWYNFTTHSWFMISYGWSAGETDHPANDERARKRAFDYYRKALQYEQDSETKAKLNYMLALLASEENEKKFAREYERYKATDFYLKRNCLTTREIAGI